MTRPTRLATSRGCCSSRASSRPRWTMGACTVAAVAEPVRFAYVPCYLASISRCVFSRLESMCGGGVYRAQVGPFGMILECILGWTIRNDPVTWTTQAAMARAHINHPAAPGHLSVLARAERARSITAVFFSPGAWCHSASRLVRGRPPWIGSPRCSTTRWAETPSVDKLLRGAGQGAVAMGAADQVRWRGAVRQKPTGRARAERRRALRAIAARGTAWGTAWAPAACLPLPS